jgi:hypothetical protein
MTLLFCNLEPDEYDMLIRNIMHSGGTGATSRPEDYNGLAPYIATEMSQLHLGLAYLEWNHCHMFRIGDSYAIRSIRRWELAYTTVERRDRYFNPLSSTGPFTVHSVELCHNCYNGDHSMHDDSAYRLGCQNEHCSCGYDEQRHVVRRVKS